MASYESDRKDSPAPAPVPVRRVQRDVARRLWCAISPGVNNPRDCEPSEELAARLLEEAGGDRKAATDAGFRLGRRALRLSFPGLDRPLGSCFHPWVAALLDVAAYYGRTTQAVLDRTAHAAGEVATTRRALPKAYTAEGFISPAGDQLVHIQLCPTYVAALAEAIREGRAPALNEIDPSFFEEGWASEVASRAALAEAVESTYGHLVRLAVKAGVDLGELELLGTFASRELTVGRLCGHTTEWSHYEASTDGAVETLTELKP